MDGVAQTIKESDVICRNLRLASSIGHLGEKFAGLQNPFGGTVAIGAVCHGQVGNNLFHPSRDDFALGNRVTDILHVGIDAERFELVGNIHNGPDFICQLACTDMNDIVAHDVSSSFRLKLKRPWAVAHGLDSVK